MEIESRVHDFLNRDPGLLAVVGTTSADGMPHLVPVWYRWDGKEIHIWSLESRAWIKNLKRDSRIGFSAQEDGVPRTAVMIKGLGRVETSDDPAIDEELWAISRRYVPASELDEYVASWSHLRTMVHIEPTKLFVWN